MGWLSDVYTVCAAVGGTVLVVQTLMMLVGSGGEHDVPHDAADAGVGHLGDGDVGHVGEDLSFVKWLSLKTIVSALTFFGLAGLAAERAALPSWAGLGLAVLAGSVAIVAVAFLMAGLARLQSRGNVELRNAVGATARVYLRVPAARGGRGKVTVEVQGRSLEVGATTAGAELPTGATVRVVAVLGEDLLDVSPLAG